MQTPMIPMTIPRSAKSRREVIAIGLAGMAAAMLPVPALALTDAQAKSLIGKAVNDVNAAIASGKTGPALYALFERIFENYADVDVIARSALGVAARRASPAQMRAFTKAFTGYLSRKYGQRFREFAGAKFHVGGARPVKSFYEVKTTAVLRGQAPFEVLWQVSDRSGSDRFFNLIVEGVNMLASERTEIGAMLDKRHGNIDSLIRDLGTAG